MPKETVSQTPSFVCPLDQAGQVGDDILPVVGGLAPGNNAQMGIKGREGIGTDSGMSPGDTAKKGGLPGIGKSQKTDLRHDLELELQKDFLGGFPGFRKIGGLAGRCRKMGVAPSSASSLGRSVNLPFGNQIGQKLSRFGIMDLCPQGKPENQILSVLAVLFLSPAIFTGGGDHPGTMLEVEQS